MEIYRTDGGGKTYADKRLLRITEKIEKNIPKNVIDEIEIINDHKGELNIVLSADCVFSFDTIELFYVLLLNYWKDENECNVTIYKNGVGVIGYQIGNKL